VKGSDQIRGRRTLDCDAVQSVKHETRKGDSARGAGGGEYLWWGEVVVSVFDFGLGGVLLTMEALVALVACCSWRPRRPWWRAVHGGLVGLGGVLLTMEAS
jgi:hypothetical protein